MTSCSNDSNAFAITLVYSPSRDEHCTAFGLVDAGAPVVQAIGEHGRTLSKPVEILRIDLLDKAHAAAMVLAPVKLGS